MKDCRSTCGSIQRPSVPGSSHGWICQFCSPDPAQTPELYNVKYLMKKSMIMDQNMENSGRIKSYAVEAKAGETEDFAGVFQEKYPKVYGGEFAAFKRWQKEFVVVVEECRRRGVFLDQSSDGGVFSSPGPAI